ncbi:unnamed protein product [Fusarium graminearum]|nr:unnamed protein product [Fusarium graminearum]
MYPRTSTLQNYYPSHILHLINMSNRVYFSVEGRVQGVGFSSRIWCDWLVPKHKGWETFEVEGEAQASEEILSKFFKDVDDGPRSARVTKVSQEERQIIEGETDFTVTR